VKEAEKSYRRAIEKTHDARAYNNLAWLYYTRRPSEEAEELARKLWNSRPILLTFRIRCGKL
jgi:tetratricopeptide (TPR) repeat protein